MPNTPSMWTPRRNVRHEVGSQVHRGRIDVHWFMVVIGGRSPLTFGVCLRGRYAGVRKTAEHNDMRLLQLSGPDRLIGRLYPPTA
jgi:hypothetical protein